MFFKVAQSRVSHRNRGGSPLSTNPHLLQVVEVSEDPFELEDLGIPGSSRPNFEISGFGAALHQPASETRIRTFRSESVGEIEVSTQFLGTVPSKPAAERSAGRVVRV